MNNENWCESAGYVWHLLVKVVKYKYKQTYKAGAIGTKNK